MESTEMPDSVHERGARGRPRDAAVEAYAASVYGAWVSAAEELGKVHEGDADVSRAVARMRDILVDWLWDVHVYKGIGVAAMLLAIQLVDRRLARVPRVARCNMQKMGMACLMIASKIEDIYYISPYELYPLSAGGVSYRRLLHAEAELCRMLRYNFALPTAFHFLAHYSQCVAPGCTRILDSALAALHAMTLSSTDASFAPRLAAAGCVAWAVRNMNLLNLDHIAANARAVPWRHPPQEDDSAKRPTAAAPRDTRINTDGEEDRAEVWEEEEEARLCASETARVRVRRHWCALRTSCGLASSCLREAYLAATRSVAAQCASKDSPNSFLKHRVGRKCTPAALRTHLKRVSEKCLQQMDEVDPADACQNAEASGTGDGAKARGGPRCKCAACLPPRHSVTEVTAVTSSSAST